MAIDEGILPKDEYSDPEDFKDDVSDSELLGELKFQEPSESQYEERCLLVFGIPIAGEDRLEKLKKVLGKLFSMTHPEYKDTYPLDADKKTKGFCFLEYPNKESADAAYLLLDGHILDKNHTFSAYLFTSLRKIEEPAKNWQPPKKRDYVDVGDLWSWLQNPKCLDQFAIQVSNPSNNDMTIAVYWNGRGSDPVLVNDDAVRENWSENIFKWSPHGTYMSTMHKPGVALWGGENFTKIQRFSHEHVNFIEFSPNEKYLVTYSRESHGDRENCLRIFDVFTSELKKSFSPSGQNSARIHDWPFFKWSHNEKYFAFCRPKGNTINVYETDSFTLCDNAPIELEGLVSFEWNPAKNLIAYYCEERIHANAPAEIGILEFPSRQKVRAQRIFSVSGANLLWQKAGNYLAAHTERFNNARKTRDKEVKLTGVASHLEIFDFTEKEVSVQTLQLNEPFINFGWEPKGDKFCVLIGQTTRVTPLVYRLDKGKPFPQLISKIEAGTQLNTIEWSPQGGWFTVFGINSAPGHVFFIDTNGAEAVRSRIVEHPNMNQGCWDPTGRYFVTCSMGRNRYESGYRIHSFQGRELFKKNIECLLRFKWRPRPPVVLSDAKIKEIRKNLKQISAKFEEEDRREQLLVSKELIEARQTVMAQFVEIRTQVKAYYEQLRDERIALRNGVDTDIVDKDLVEETITIPLNTIIEVIEPIPENKLTKEENEEGEEE